MLTYEALISKSLLIETVCLFVCFFHFREEIFTILKKFAVLSAMECLPFTLGSAATLLSVYTLSFTGVPVTPLNGFVLLSFLNILRKTLLIKNALAIQSVSELYVSLQRIEKFLLIENLPFRDHGQADHSTSTLIKDLPLIFVKEPHLTRLPALGPAAMGEEIEMASQYPLSVSELAWRAKWKNQSRNIFFNT